MKSYIIQVPTLDDRLAILNTFDAIAGHAWKEKIVIFVNDEETGENAVRSIASLSQKPVHVSNSTDGSQLKQIMEDFKKARPDFLVWSRDGVPPVDSIGGIVHIELPRKENGRVDGRTYLARVKEMNPAISYKMIVSVDEKTSWSEIGEKAKFMDFSSEGKFEKWTSEQAIRTVLP